MASLSSCSVRLLAPGFIAIPPPRTRRPPPSRRKRCPRWWRPCPFPLIGSTGSGTPAAGIRPPSTCLPAGLVRASNATCRATPSCQPLPGRCCPIGNNGQGVCWPNLAPIAGVCSMTGLLMIWSGNCARNQTSSRMRGRRKAYHHAKVASAPSRILQTEPCALRSIRCWLPNGRMTRLWRCYQLSARARGGRRIRSLRAVGRASLRGFVIRAPK